MPKIDDRLMTALMIWEDHRENSSVFNTHPLSRLREEEGLHASVAAVDACVPLVALVWDILPEAYKVGASFVYDFIPEFMQFCGMHDIEPWEVPLNEAGKLAQRFFEAQK